MSFQSTVRNDIAAGVVGDVAFSGPQRVKTYIITSGDAANNVIGRAFTRTSEGVVAAGGTGVFAGILINSKHYASYGTAAGGPLAATLALPNGQNGEFLEMGEVYVALDAAATPASALKYVDATGEIKVGAPGAGETALPGSVVNVYDATSPGFLAVIKLTN